MFASLRKFKKKKKLLSNIKKKLGKKFNEIDLIIPVNEKSEQKIRELKDLYKWHNDLNTNIHKNDLMFLTSLLAVKELQQAYRAYLVTGYNARNIIIKLVSLKYKNPGNVSSLLDFASGYGRLTRFIVFDFKPEKIWVSEIKSKALEFQKEQFGVNTIQSSYIPEEFKPGKKFDIIFAGSLFSHLPEDLFKRWLKILYNCLSKNGIFIFSVLALEKYGTGNEPVFEYKEINEDQHFEIVNDRIKKTDSYGMAYVSEQFVKNVLINIAGINENEYKQYKNAFGTTQDIYAVSKNADTYSTNVDLSTYP